MGFLDGVISWTLFLISVSALVGVAQAFLKKGIRPRRRVTMLALALGALAPYAWLMYMDGIVEVDRTTGKATDPLGLAVHAADDSWIALLWHPIGCAHARLVLLTGVLPLGFAVGLFWSRFRRAAGIQEVAAGGQGRARSSGVAERHFVELFGTLGREWAARYFAGQGARELQVFDDSYRAHPWRTARAYQKRIVAAYSAFMTPMTVEERRQFLDRLVPGFTSVDFEGGFVWGRAAFLAEIQKYVDEFGVSRHKAGV